MRIKEYGTVNNKRIYSLVSIQNFSRKLIMHDQVVIQVNHTIRIRKALEFVYFVGILLPEVFPVFLVYWCHEICVL